MATAQLKIKITSAAGSQARTIPKSTATIGAADHCDVRLAHPTVEAEHARAWVEGGRLWVQDLGSGAGTYLNGSRLPAMKPMLVRDLDQLRIGESAETLGFDKPSADLVRAPRVAPPVGDEAALTEVRAAPAPAPPAPVDDARAREERARVSRELAEMRLQLQMGQLEKNGVDELRGQVNELRADLSRLEDERRELKASLARNRETEAARQAQFDVELTEKHARSDRELSDLRERQERQLGQWKLEVVNALVVEIQDGLNVKAQAWAKRPLTAEMMRELEGDVSAAVRGTLIDGSATPRASVAPIVESPLVARRFPVRHAATALVAALVMGAGVQFYRGRAPGAGARAPASAAFAQVKRDQEAKASLVENLISTVGYFELAQASTWRKARFNELQRAPWAFDVRTAQALIDREAALLRDLSLIRDRTVAGHEPAALTAMHAREADYARALLASFGGDQATFDRYVAGRTAAIQRLLPR